jgi:hypothetical protein
MNANIANTLNAVVLIAMGLWGYLSSDSPSMTALIPVIFGVIFLLMSQGLKKKNKIISHVIVILTLLVMISLFKPLSGAMQREDSMAILRVGLMILSSLIAMIFFIKNFIDARKSKA